MTARAPVPPNESERLLRLHELMVLDTLPEPFFDALARMASEVCGTPVALLSLVDADRQWFKSNHGLPGTTQTPRDQAFCAHAILDDVVMEVPDAKDDPRFAQNPLVTSPAGIRFYAGAPLSLPGGERLGALCVIDYEARRLSPPQLRMLAQLAELASHALVMRRELIARSLSARSDYEQSLAQSEARHRALVEDQAEMVSQAQQDGTLVYVNPAYARHFGLRPGDMLGNNLFDYVRADDRTAVRALVAEVLATGISRRGENRMVETDGTERWIAWTNTRQQDAQGRVLLHSVGRDITERKNVELRLAENERFVRLITDSLPLRVAYLDREWRYRFVNRAYSERFALPRAQIIGQRRSELLGEPPDAQLLHWGAAALAGVSQRFEFDERVGDGVRRIDGQMIPYIAPDGTVRGVYSIGIDITERAAAEQQMRALAATLRSVTEAIPAIVAVLGADLRYRFVNSAFERWQGAPRDQIIGRTVAEVLGEAELAATLPWIRRVLAGETVDFERDDDDARIRHVAVSYIPLWLDNGAQDGFVGIVQDITTHRQEARRLLQLSQRDPLTGLLNRSGFEAWLEARLQDGAGPDLALLYIDLDHFKPVNDRHGHPVGDAVLQIFSQRVQALVRPTDAVARLGGDEFAVVLAGVRDAGHAQAVADKIVAAACEPMAHGELRLSIGASVGIAVGADAQTGWRGLMARADARVYQAKAAGRGRATG